VTKGDEGCPAASLNNKRGAANGAMSEGVAENEIAPWQMKPND